MKRFVFVAILAVAAVYTAPAIAAPSGRYSCDGVIGGDPYSGGEPQLIESNVDVPAGAYCYMYATEVTGNVTVEGALIGFGNTFDRNVTVDGGSVRFGNPYFSHGLGESHISGNLTIVTSGDVELSVTVGKNLTLVGAHSADFTYTGVGGNVAAIGSADVVFFDSFVGGNVTLIGNHGVTIGSTAIGGTLNCQANDPPPVVEPQVTARSATGQCTLTP